MYEDTTGETDEGGTRADLGESSRDGNHSGPEQEVAKDGEKTVPRHP